MIGKSESNRVSFIKTKTIQLIDHLDMPKCVADILILLCKDALLRYCTFESTLYSNPYV